MDSSTAHDLDMQRENNFMIKTLEILDEERKNILTEVLKCSVCLDLPKGKQVKICQRGHHFCSSCHNQLNVCGLCRGNLLESRNFVVEELVTKLGAVLGVPDVLSHREPPVKLSRGSFPCLHGCSCKMAAFQVLPHLRAKHSEFLVENVLSNPYLGKFSFTYRMCFEQEKNYLWSVFVSDMGLFTFELTFSNWNFCGWVRVLGDDTVSNLFQHQLILRVPSRGPESVFEFSVTDCPISCYTDSFELSRAQGWGLSIKGADLLEKSECGCEMTVFISIWKKNNKSEARNLLMPFLAHVPQSHEYIKFNRRAYRNKGRNMRRKKLKEKQRNSGRNEELEEAFFRITL